MTRETTLQLSERLEQTPGFMKLRNVMRFNLKPSKLRNGRTPSLYHDTTRLPQPMTVKGFDGKYDNTVTHFLIINLTLDERRQADIPLCILDIGSHDIILGQKWM